MYLEHPGTLVAIWICDDMCMLLVCVIWMLSISLKPPFHCNYHIQNMIVPSVMIHHIYTFHHIAFEVFWKYVAENDPKIARNRDWKEQKSLEELKVSCFSGLR